MRMVAVTVLTTLFLMPTSAIFAQTGAGATREGKELKLPEASKPATAPRPRCTQVTHPCGVNNSQICTVKRCSRSFDGSRLLPSSA